MRMQSFKVILLLTVAVVAVQAQAFVPRGAFIRRPVKSTPDLIAHVKSDPIVMDRFVRHFRLKPDQVVSYFKTLHMAKLARDGAYTVFNVHEDNVLRSRVFQLKKGTLVFADQNGRPILKKECANPMVFEIPPLGSDPGVTAPVLGREFNGPDTESLDMLQVMEPSIMPIEIVGEAPVAPVLPPVQAGTITGRSSNLFPLLLLGVPFLFTGGDEPDPVPEPATMLVLAAGAGYISFKRKRK